MRWLWALALALGLSFNGCMALDPKLIEALAKDDASVCISMDTRGGAGGIIGGATGGYGSHTLNLCRSGKDNAKLTMNKDGSMSVQNGNEVFSEDPAGSKSD